MVKLFVEVINLPMLVWFKGFHEGARVERFWQVMSVKAFLRNLQSPGPFAVGIYHLQTSEKPLNLPSFSAMKSVKLGIYQHNYSLETPSWEQQVRHKTAKRFGLPTIPPGAAGAGRLDGRTSWRSCRPWIGRTRRISAWPRHFVGAWRCWRRTWRQDADWFGLVSLGVWKPKWFAWWCFVWKPCVLKVFYWDSWGISCLFFQPYATAFAECFKHFFLGFFWANPRFCGPVWFRLGLSPF